MSHPHGQEGPSLLANAEAARIVSDTPPSAEVDRLFFEHPDLTSVVVEDGAGPLRVLTRRTQATEMTGRLGYGRSLYCGRSVGSLPFVGPALVLDDASSLVEAGRRALARPPQDRYEEVIIRDRQGALATLTVARLCSELAELHADRAVHDRLTGLASRELLIQRQGSAVSG